MPDMPPVEVDAVAVGRYGEVACCPLLEPDRMDELADAVERLTAVFTAAFRRLTEVFRQVGIVMQRAHDAILQSHNSSIVVDDDETVVVGASSFHTTDSAPHDYRIVFCWRCDAVRVPDDPKHCGACDACVDDLRNGDGPKDDEAVKAWRGIIRNGNGGIVVTRVTFDDDDTYA